MGETGFRELPTNSYVLSPAYSLLEESWRDTLERLVLISGDFIA